MAENFIVSARKYRPDTWETVVGQKHITTTLQNAIATSQIAQAYLFTGPRGVGKTTCARIFAKAVNGMIGHEMDEMQFNVFELDAASNNSVDDIRSIVDSVRIPPQQGQYKVYIIDEVHMLSQAAFNAFLKTLEEPPAHAVFILATTEKHKILPTILSRCQIFDFNRIKVRDMTDHLASIATKEGITADEKALHVIAQKADGAMRDALSIFDQVVAFCGKNLTYEVVIQNLNVLDYDYYFRLMDLVMGEDVPGCLVLLNEVVDKGFDAHHFITGLGGHVRNLLVSKDAATIALMEVSESIAAKYQAQAASADLRMLITALDLINQCDTQYRASKHQRLLVELTLMKMASILLNNREGEKKKFKLKPFRTGSAAPKEARPAIPSSRPAPETLLGKEQATEVATAVTSKPFSVFGNRDKINQSTDGFSIRKTMARTQNAGQQAEEQEAEIKKEVATRLYSIGEIRVAWKRFAEEKLLSNLQVKTVFSVAALELVDNETLRVAFPSETQSMYFNDHRSQIGDFLRNEYDIRGLDFKVEILKQDEIKQVFKTDKQRFEEMVAKNPALETLRKKFGLQVDF